MSGRLKVVHLYRAPKSNRYSIERVFGTIEANFSDEVTVERFYIDPNISLFRNIRRASKLRADVFHITGDCNYLALGLPKCRTVLTVHDVGHYEVTLKGLRKVIYGFFWWKLPLRRVKQVVAISRFTKERIQSNFNVSPEKIKVIYDPLPYSGVGKIQPFNDECPVILQIGSGRNKNVYGLITALSGLKVKLILINDFDEGVKQSLQANNIMYEQYTNLPYQEVVSLYKRADILFFASFYEGFGMPIIEAQHVGIPVLTSNIAPMPEVAGGGALLVDPSSVDEIRNAILRLINSRSLREELVEKGRENVKRFQSEMVAQQYYEIYKGLEGTRN